jgi:hypothetical protein
VKKILLLTTAVLFATPAFAWRAIAIHNDTDPVNVQRVIFTAPGIPAVSYTLDLPGGPGWYRVFGPLPETGPCLRVVTVVVTHPNLGWATKAAATPFNVCTENTIWVTGAWPGMGGKAGGSELIVTHGF